MRIRLLTHPLGTNYGGILQNYALQVVLKSMGHDPITQKVYFDTPQRVKFFSFLSRLFKCILGKKVPLKAWLSDDEFSLISINTSKFIKRYIKTTNAVEISSGNLFIDNDFDAIIVGSDQVWRGSDKNVAHFFLSDIKDDNVIRLSYAASFGVDNWEFSPKNTQKCRMLAKKFHGISVREQSGIVLCRDYLHVHSECVLDPTLLLDMNHYSTLIPENLTIEGDYLMEYILDKSSEKNEILTMVSKKINAAIHTVMPKHYYSEVGSKGIEECIYPPVEDWIAGIKHSKFVVTDSFHGMVFSIIFHKPFIAIVNNKRGAARFYSLLNLLNLSSRLVDNKHDAALLIDTPIDYREVDRIIEEKRTSSINFLLRHLK